MADVGNSHEDAGNYGVYSEREDAEPTCNVVGTYAIHYLEQTVNLGPDYMMVGTDVCKFNSASTPTQVFTESCFEINEYSCDYVRINHGTLEHDEIGVVKYKIYSSVVSGKRRWHYSINMGESEPIYSGYRDHETSGTGGEAPNHADVGLQTVGNPDLSIPNTLDDNLRYRSTEGGTWTAWSDADCNTTGDVAANYLFGAKDSWLRNYGPGGSQCNYP